MVPDVPLLLEDDFTLRVRHRRSDGDGVGVRGSLDRADIGEPALG